MKKPPRVVWFLLVLLALLPGAASASDAVDCASGPAQVAQANATSLTGMPVNLFGRQETGWAVYEPLVSNEISTSCAAATPGFAHALAQWQSAHHLSGAGTMNTATLTAMKQVWQARRPFVIASRHGCPEPPIESTLARAAPSESYGGKTILLRAVTLGAFRQMIVAARAEGLLPAGSHVPTIFSGYRSPAYDAARCAAQQNCQGIVRASCSAHRTGDAMDIDFGAAPGFPPDSSADANRLFISRTPIYRWLVKNAARFHLFNYAFEPWHWEYAPPAP
jgi:LAS superfamily LD-carboxypeptidase LdcB